MGPYHLMGIDPSSGAAHMILDKAHLAHLGLGTLGFTYKSCGNPTAALPPQPYLHAAAATLPPCCRGLNPTAVLPRPQPYHHVTAAATLPPCCRVRIPTSTLPPQPCLHTVAATLPPHRRRHHATVVSSPSFAPIFDPYFTSLLHRRRYPHRIAIYLKVH
ncbi:hypothetical protein GUJ93_ZPchr0008g12892 [Zizania palustris]|uniref:Uncharacterized protein n=1 Tax=Zizania palustris TaxID=103762 RepID=A0A8J5R6G0_ZIZPA|nr:hypothetical protein GUJ93_ZPchr0008g12892 [Zizania palustris]